MTLLEETIHRMLGGSAEAKFVAEWAVVNITSRQVAALAGINFLFIAAKAFQQLNVMHHKVTLVPIFSVIMGLCEVFLWGGAAVAAVKGTTADMLIYALTLGASGAVGAVLSMYVHRWMRKEQA